MRLFFKTVVFALVVLFSACKDAPSESPEFDSQFVHVVYFWLKNPNNTADKEAFEASIKKFMAASKYAKTQFIGTPANTPRSVVDNSWTYSLIATFPSKEIQNKYQEEPAHLQFIEESSELWDKVQVYDAVGID